MEIPIARTEDFEEKKPSLDTKGADQAKHTDGGEQGDQGHDARPDIDRYEHGAGAGEMVDGDEEGGDDITVTLSEEREEELGWFEERPGWKSWQESR
ncbi:uncharacterized protein MYCFIDRAFT_211558 [Pseudocercospora fijiensis CIRAD86]|uniref:Uncharacterized protein n=1 Tax=Pseudocercospora fijiensis (strain CIRAD86) TaxID=383855 RepID=M3AYB5_PSEFD|nr:uncharacterized protein MYCFIDRAFT_211558 [Pseudocercospora fijiensis CIRAD86]EME82158.1 hypothetical protein MYCFIDRAFT_211558 [Pseudocercospora fijiensis CIRAD86]